jgi:Cft2 family RNA processing exonuclease
MIISEYWLVVGSIRELKTSIGQLEVASKIFAIFTPVGYILGSSAIHLNVGGKTITFSGDVGRKNDLVMRPPEPLKNTDYLVIESTYGNRKHNLTDPFEFFKNIVNKTMERGGTVLFPSFAVGRTQTILYILQLLKERNEIPDVPVFLNSPMAITATEIYCKHNKDHRLPAHGDYVELLEWLEQSDITPSKTFVTHGEAAASDSMRLKLEEKFGWNVEVPDLDEEFEL